MPAVVGKAAFQSSGVAPIPLASLTWTSTSVADREKTSAGTPTNCGFRSVAEAAVQLRPSGAVRIEIWTVPLVSNPIPSMPAIRSVAEKEIWVSVPLASGVPVPTLTFVSGVVVSVNARSAALTSPKMPLPVVCA